jgi:hypothetical protein
MAVGGQRHAPAALPPAMTRQKFKVKVKVALEQATKAQRWSRVIALLFL